MRTFHKNKDSKSKDKNENRFHFTLPATKTNVNIIFSWQSKISFRVNLILSLMQTSSKGWITNNSHSQ